MAGEKIKIKPSISVDPQVWKWVEASAKKHGVSVSAYVEGALIWDQVEEGNPEAWKLAVQIIREKVRKRLGVGSVLPGELALSR